MKILSIALNTFRENLRDKLLYNLLVFALLMIGSSVILSELTLGDFHRLILDLGLGSINFFGVLIAIFVGIGLVSKEIEKKTIYTIVSKPVARYQFLLGKYLGLTITLFVNTVVMALGLLLVLYAQGVPVEAMLFKALALIFVEFMVVTAVALLFSTFTSATLSAIFTLAMYVIGHLTADLKTFGAKMGDLSRGILDGIYYLLPNLERFNLKGHVVHHLCSKRLSSKAAASEEARRTLRYVEPLSDARTQLAGFFSIMRNLHLHYDQEPGIEGSITTALGVVRVVRFILEVHFDECAVA